VTGDKNLRFPKKKVGNFLMTLVAFKCLRSSVTMEFTDNKEGHIDVAITGSKQPV
jgi:hypothetical protein